MVANLPPLKTRQQGSQLGSPNSSSPKPITPKSQPDSPAHSPRSRFSPVLQPISEDRPLKLKRQSSPKAGILTKLALDIELRLTSAAEVKAKQAHDKAKQAHEDALKTGSMVKIARAEAKLEDAQAKHQKVSDEKRQIGSMVALIA